MLFFLYQNPVWRAAGEKSADAEKNGRHVDRDHNRPTVLSAAGKTHRWEKVKMTLFMTKHRAHLRPGSPMVLMISMISNASV